MCLPVYNCPPTELNSHQSDDRAPTSAGKFDQGIYKSILHAPRNYTEHSCVKTKTTKNQLGHLLDHISRMGIWKYHQRTNQPTYNTWVGLEMQPTHLKRRPKEYKIHKRSFLEGGDFGYIDHWSSLSKCRCHSDLNQILKGSVFWRWGGGNLFLQYLININNSVCL